MFAVSTLMVCGHTSASPKDVSQTMQANELAAKCGLTLAFPAQLLAHGPGKLGTCVRSYDETGSTVLSLAPIDSDVRDSNWMDRIPMLHIQDAAYDFDHKNNWLENLGTSPDHSQVYQLAHQCGRQGL
ncbi:hypothetical protein P3T22_000476 [Paraburkholderia sp. GAS348]